MLLTGMDAWTLVGKNEYKHWSANWPAVLAGYWYLLDLVDVSVKVQAICNLHICIPNPCSSGISNTPLFSRLQQVHWRVQRKQTNLTWMAYKILHTSQAEYVSTSTRENKKYHALQALLCAFNHVMCELWAIDTTVWKLPSTWKNVFQNARNWHMQDELEPLLYSWINGDCTRDYLDNKLMCVGVIVCTGCACRDAVLYYGTQVQ